MPKIPEHEWKKYTDPDSEEHTPTMGELEADTENEKNIKLDLDDIEHILKNPKKDWYTGEEKKFGITDPEDLWDRLAYLRVDYLDKIKDPELRQNLENRISKTEQAIYKQFIPFIESQINAFGWLNSSLEEHRPERKMDSKEVYDYFEQARSALAHFKISGDERIDFVSELDRLSEKFERYQNEPTLFTFEKFEEELQKKLATSEYSEWLYSWEFYKHKKTDLLIDNEEARKENLLKIELLIAKAHSLKEIAERMLNGNIKSNCLERAEALLKHTQQVKTDFEMPAELLSLEAELSDLFQRLKNKEQAGNNNLEQIKTRLNSLDKGGVNGEKIKKLFILSGKVEKLMAGEAVDEDSERFEPKIRGDINWAWLLLGVERDAPEEEVKRAYKKLARKYHPDSKVSPDADKMRQINEAFEFVSNLGGYK